MNPETHKAQSDPSLNDAGTPLGIAAGDVLVGRYQVTTELQRVGTPRSGDGQVVRARDLALAGRSLVVSYLADPSLDVSNHLALFEQLVHVAPVVDFVAGVAASAFVFRPAAHALPLLDGSGARSREANALLLLGLYETLRASEGTNWIVEAELAYVGEAIEGVSLELVPRFFASPSLAAAARELELRTWPMRVARILYGVPQELSDDEVAGFLPDTFIPHYRALRSCDVSEESGAADLPSAIELRDALLVAAPQLRLAIPQIALGQAASDPQREFDRRLRRVRRRTSIAIAVFALLVGLALWQLADLLVRGPLWR